jgi:hypothetical protein
MSEHVAPVPEDRRSLLARLLHADETTQGYLFWGPVVAAILVTEALGAFFDVPWPTISSTVGHLEDRWTIVAALVVGLIGATTYLALVGSGKSPLGRSLVRGEPKREVRFYTAWVPIAATILAGVVARSLTADKLQVGYAIYGTLAAFGLVIPSLLIVFRAEVQFPTLFFTVRKLEKRFHWVATLLVASLAILVIHLALYPWPDITKEPTQYAGLDARHAKRQALQAVSRLPGGGALKYSTQTRGVDGGHDAWLVFFTSASSSGQYSGCVVAVTDKAALPAPGCAST